MPYKRVKQGVPYSFQEFVFFSPKQFNEPVPIEEKDHIFRLKVCIDTGRCFTGPFVDEVVGEEELTKTEVTKFLDMVNNISGIIITGSEWTQYDDYGGMKKYYG